MRTVQKITAFLTAVMLLFAAGVQAFAASAVDDVMFELKTLGIMEGDENGDLQLDKSLTRAEFACITVRFMNMRKAADSYAGDASFADVSKEHWAFGSIEVLKNLGLINGTGEGKFSPDENVTMQQAAKILMSALGYSAWAEADGSYPDGYMSQAISSGLLDNVNVSSSEFTRGNAARMVYNALDIDIVTVRYSNGLPAYEKVSGDTYRNKFKGESDGTLVKYTGIVTATADAYMDSPRSDMDDNQIEIDNKLYECNDTNILSYLGQKVDFYLDSDDEYKIVSIKPNKDNNVTSIDADSVRSASKDSISYYTEGTKSETKRLSQDAVLLINNRVAASWSEQTIMGLENGTITFVDNNDDNYAEVVIIKSYTSVMVDSVNVSSSNIYLRDTDTVAGKKYISLDTDKNRDKRVTVKYADNTPVNIEDIKKDDVLSAFVSADETVIELILESKSVSGVISQISEDTAVIAGEEYELETDAALKNVSVNDDVEAYLNFMGQVVYAKASEVTGNYAYILKAYKTEDGESYEAKLLIPDTLTEVKEEEENEDGGEATVTSKLVCKNEKVLTLPLANSISLDRQKVDSKSYANLSGLVVEYKLNSAGEISKLTTPEQIGTGTEKYYNSSERTFGKTSGGAFGISLDTKTICIPKDNANPGKDDCLVYVDMNNGQKYDVKGYDKNENSYTADLIVVTATMKSGTEGLVTTSSDVAMVQNVSQTVDDDNEDVVIVKVLTKDGNETEYELTQACVDSSDYTAPQKGSLIAYSLDNEYKMDKFKVLGVMSAQLDYGLVGLRKDYETFAGFAADITYNDVSEELNRWVSTMQCTLEENGTEIERTYEILKNNTPPVFLCNPKTMTSEFGELKDISLGTDQIFVSAASNKVRAIVVIKN